MRAGLSMVNSRLLRAIRTRASGLPGDEGQGAPPLLVIEDFSETPWASLTFSGSRHSVDIRLEGGGAAVRKLAGELAEWPDSLCDGLAGHFLAEMGVTEGACVHLDDGRMSLSLRLEALTIEE